MQAKTKEKSFVSQISEPWDYSLFNVIELKEKNKIWTRPAHK